MINEFVEYVKEVFGVNIIIKPSTESSDTFESLFCNLMEVENVQYREYDGAELKEKNNE